MFTTLGELRDYYLVLFGSFAVVFLLIWIAAFITGVVLTRQITKAIADLYHATQYVQSGDLTHRVRIERRDQLGVLGGVVQPDDRLDQRADRRTEKAAAAGE